MISRKIMIYFFQKLDFLISTSSGSNIMAYLLSNIKFIKYSINKIRRMHNITLYVLTSVDDERLSDCCCDGRTKSVHAILVTFTII